MAEVADNAGTARTLTAAVLNAGRSAGLDSVGVASAEPFENTQRHLEQRRDLGLSADMEFTYRNPERSCDPSRILPGAKTLVVGAMRYASDRPDTPTEEPAARVARYATIDQYAQLRSRLDSVAAVLADAGFASAVVADQNSLVDREAAYRAGIGWYGKSSNLLIPGRGSWFVIGSVVTDAPLIPHVGREPDGCGSCRRCLDGCPTGAIIEPGVVDARRCLAWLVQSTAYFEPEYRRALGDRIYGCDDCQEVCPPNKRQPDDRGESVETAPTPTSPPMTPITRSIQPSTPAPSTPAHAMPTSSSMPASTSTLTQGQPWIGVLTLLESTDEEILSQIGRWYIPRREARWVRRNALYVLANIGRPGDDRTRAVIRAQVLSPDAEVRAAAVWTCRRLGLESLAASLRDDVDEVVQQEWSTAL